MIARLIHQRSRRAHTPLVAVNCAGIPDSLLESALFGHMRGSFTGAYRDRLGLFEIAHGGTVFLDEIGEMRMRMQALLLRFLENGEIQRVGADRLHTRVDVRVIAATNRNVIERIASKDFREDLYYRLNVISVNIPPLRSRREDIPLLTCERSCGEAWNEPAATTRCSSSSSIWRRATTSGCSTSCASTTARSSSSASVRPGPRNRTTERLEKVEQYSRRETFVFRVMS